ncbi:hypothetical protein [Bacillus sp. AG4(2022)]|nr:hypothetical protein [Bacillus sp. AG4(2022)]MDT0160252.1 hypothetical protein [Bacillus sp. AG4(2022)]
MLNNNSFYVNVRGKGKSETVINFDPTKVAIQNTKPEANKFWIDTSK